MDASKEEMCRAKALLFIFLMKTEMRNIVRVRGCSNRYLGHMDKLGENLRSKLSRRPAQHHQLDPLGDAITQRDGALHHWDVLHAAVPNVILIVYKLAQSVGR